MMATDSFETTGPLYPLQLSVVLDEACSAGLPVRRCAANTSCALLVHFIWASFGYNLNKEASCNTDLTQQQLAVERSRLNTHELRFLRATVNKMTAQAGECTTAMVSSWSLCVHLSARLPVGHARRASPSVSDNLHAGGRGPCQGPGSSEVAHGDPARRVRASPQRSGQCAPGTIKS
jgi:hypothetical protein